MTPAKRRSTGIRARRFTLAPGDLLHKCWFSKTGSVQFLSIRKEDGHLDVFVTWFGPDGAPQTRTRCGVDDPISDTDLELWVKDLQEGLRGVGSKINMEMIDFSPIKTRVEQLDHLRSLGWDLEGRRV